MRVISSPCLRPAPEQAFCDIDRPWGEFGENRLAAGWCLASAATGPPECVWLRPGTAGGRARPGPDRGDGRTESNRRSQPRPPYAARLDQGLAVGAPHRPADTMLSAPSLSAATLPADRWRAEWLRIGPSLSPGAAGPRSLLGYLTEVPRWPRPGILQAEPDLVMRLVAVGPHTSHDVHLGYGHITRRRSAESPSPLPRSLCARRGVRRQGWGLGRRWAGQGRPPQP